MRNLAKIGPIWREKQLKKIEIVIAMAIRGGLVEVMMIVPLRKRTISIGEHMNISFKLYYLLLNHINHIIIICTLQNIISINNRRDIHQKKKKKSISRLVKCFKIQTV